MGQIFVDKHQQTYPPCNYIVKCSIVFILKFLFDIYLYATKMYNAADFPMSSSKRVCKMLKFKPNTQNTYLITGDQRANKSKSSCYTGSNFLGCQLK